MVQRNALLISDSGVLKALNTKGLSSFGWWHVSAMIDLLKVNPQALNKEIPSYSMPGRYRNRSVPVLAPT